MPWITIALAFGVSLLLALIFLSAYALLEPWFLLAKKNMKENRIRAGFGIKPRSLFHSH